jgi:hypothetical protein
MPAQSTALSDSLTGKQLNGKKFSKNLLDLSGKAWFVVAVFGQWFFATYVAMFYGKSAITGNFEAWAKVLPQGLISGDPVGNAVLVSHLLIAAIIIYFGPLQFIPKLRKDYPKFHRYNGRLWLIFSVIAGIGGIYMTWTRETVGSTIMHSGTTLNGIFIVAFACLTPYYILQRNYKAHERWAFRLFLVVSGVWFFRIGLMFWLLVNGGPVWFDPQNFTGPFLSFWSFGQYLVPLLFLEGYYRAKDGDAVPLKFGMGLLIFILTAATALGIFGAVMGMWLPRM